MMNERTIQQRLRVWAHNHKYVLVNAFVFAWESDFFSVTKSGTVYEVEVKISKSDFKKDFGKEKHKYFQALADGLKYKVIPHDNHSYAAHLFDINIGHLYMDRWFAGGFDEDFTNDDAFGYWTRRQRFINIHYHRERVYAPATSIRIEELAKALLPNRFYYACPEGLLTRDDMPKYAGLLYITEHGVEMVKQAPFLHKNELLNQKLLGILLEKFWYLSQNQRYHLAVNKIAFKDSYDDIKSI